MTAYLRPYPPVRRTAYFLRIEQLRKHSGVLHQLQVRWASGCPAVSGCHSGSRHVRSQRLESPAPPPWAKSVDGRSCGFEYLSVPCAIHCFQGRGCQTNQMFPLSTLDDCNSGFQCHGPPAQPAPHLTAFAPGDYGVAWGQKTSASAIRA
jgi:hypothetical protein